MATLHYKNLNHYNNNGSAELQATTQKSYYGKAIVSDYGDVKVLYSYNTPVCAINKLGIFYKLWSGYSQTTMKHIRDFIKQNLNGYILKLDEWRRLETSYYGYDEACGYKGWGIFSHK